jgi:hypothetical protein
MKKTGVSGGVTKKKRNRKRNRKLDPKLWPKVGERIRKIDPKLWQQLTERILPPGPPKPKVTPQFRARFLAFVASHDLRAFAGTIHNGALHGDKLFFDYLAKYLRNQPIRLPISEEQRKLLQLHFQKPHLDSSEALKELPWLRSKKNYRSMKKRALERSALMTYVWRNGWLE